MTSTDIPAEIVFAARLRRVNRIKAAALVLSALLGVACALILKDAAAFLAVVAGGAAVVVGIDSGIAIIPPARRYLGMAQTPDEREQVIADKAGKMGLDLTRQLIMFFYIYLAWTDQATAATIAITIAMATYLAPSMYARHLENHA